MRYLSGLIGLSLVAMTGACGGDVVAPPIASLEGSWERLDEIPGSSEHWSLALDGSGVVGTGTWSGEACCGGPLSIVGSVAGDSVHLDITLVVSVGNPAPDHHEHFDGALISAAELRGKTVFDGGAAGTVRMRKR